MASEVVEKNIAGNVNRDSSGGGRMQVREGLTKKVLFVKSPKRGEGGSQPCRYPGKERFKEVQQVQRPCSCIRPVVLEQQGGQCGVAREVGVYDGGMI